MAKSSAGKVFGIQYSQLSKEDASRIARMRRGQGKVGVRVVKKGNTWSVGWKDYSYR
jgi:hypothetical protein